MDIILSASLATVCLFFIKVIPLFFHNDRWMFTYCLPTTGFTLLIQTQEALKILIKKNKFELKETMQSGSI